MESGTRGNTLIEVEPIAPAFMGIDPGVSGGIAVIEGDGQVSLYTADKLTLRDRWRIINRYCSFDFAVVEKPPGFVPILTDKASASGERGAAYGSPGYHMQKLGQSFGEYVMALTAASIPFEEKMPQAWQKEFGLKKEKGESQSKWKNRIKAIAERKFPKAGVTLATCDALLIALYARLLKEKE